MLWIMMISLQKMFTPFVTKSMLSLMKNENY
jgi:hypothetical protein